MVVSKQALQKRDGHAMAVEQAARLEGDVLAAGLTMLHVHERALAPKAFNQAAAVGAAAAGAAVSRLEDIVRPSKTILQVRELRLARRNAKQAADRRGSSSGGGGRDGCEGEGGRRTGDGDRQRERDGEGAGGGG